MRASTLDELNELKDRYVAARVHEEYQRRERLAEWALWTCAFLNELSAVSEAGQPNSWRLQ